jgi:hypothetical protein
MNHTRNPKEGEREREIYFYGFDPMVKDIYFYCLALDLMVICDGRTMYGWVNITALLVAWATRGWTRSGY